MMAPVVFTPYGPSAAAAPSGPTSIRDLLRELQDALADRGPSASPTERDCHANGGAAGSAPFQVPLPPSDETVEQRLSRIDGRLDGLQQTLQSAADAILKLDSRLRVLEGQ